MNFEQHLANELQTLFLKFTLFFPFYKLTDMFSIDVHLNVCLTNMIVNFKK